MFVSTFASLLALASYLQAEDPQTNRVLEVLLLDEENKPVPGAPVRWLDCERTFARYDTRSERIRNWEWPHLVERHGETILTDGIGIGRIESPGKRIGLAATMGALYAFAITTGADCSPIQLTLRQDHGVRILALDARGRPCSGVPVCLLQIIRPGSLTWMGTTGDEGLATLEHAQLYIAPALGFGRKDEPCQAFTLGFPMREQLRIPIGPHVLPNEPVVLQMPAMGSVEIVVPGSDDCSAQVRIVPADPGRPFWWDYWSHGLPRARMSGGRAHFPFVEVGLQLQFEVHCNGWDRGSRWIAEGPAADGETRTIQFSSIGDLAPPELLPNQVCILENNKPVRFRWASLCAQQAFNARFSLCFVPEEDRGTDRDFALQFADHRPRERFWHAVEGLESGHFGFAIEPGEEGMVSQSLGVPVVKRGEKPYRLEASFRTDQRVYPTGSEIIVEVRLSNNGTTPVTFQAGGWQRGANRHARFRFEVVRDETLLPEIDGDHSWGGPALERVIEPGRSIKDSANVSQWAHFDRPGIYDIAVIYELCPGNALALRERAELSSLARELRRRVHRPPPDQRGVIERSGAICTSRSVVALL